MVTNVEPGNVVSLRQQAYDTSPFLGYGVVLGEEVWVLGTMAEYACVQKDCGNQGYFKKTYLQAATVVAKRGLSVRVNAAGAPSILLRQQAYDASPPSYELCVLNGETVTILSEKGEYVRVQKVNGIEGYIKRKYVQVAPVVEAAHHMRVHRPGKKFLRLRQQAYDESDFFEHGVVHGEAVTVLGHEREYAWVVTSEGLEGYLKAQWLQKAHDMRVMMVHTPVNTTKYLRKQAYDASPTKEQSVVHGEAVMVLGHEGDYAWVQKVGNGAGEGYLNLKYLQATKTPSSRYH